MRVIQVAVPVPLRRTFDYRIPEKTPWPPLGVRVQVPFGRRHRLVGVVVGRRDHSDVPAARLKSIVQVLDVEPLLSEDMLALLIRVSEYYHHPLGEVVAAALPVSLRQGRAAEAPVVMVWMPTAAGLDIDLASVRGALRQRVLAALRQTPVGLDTAQLKALSPRAMSALKALAALGWAQSQRREPVPEQPISTMSPPALNPAQQMAVATIVAARGFHSFLLHGITGSGKTEVYMRAIAEIIAAGRQALVLVPEIGLTPQLVHRFKARFNAPVVVLHSGLTDSERLRAWLAARASTASIVLGTRSAVFVPAPKLGLIVIDEEHDPSYKQQDGFRYNARDVAVLRASRAGAPIVLGSATPSLESLHKARSGSYRLLELPERAGVSGLPAVGLLDMRRLAPVDGLSHPLRVALVENLARGEQSLLFLNRRGYAPVWMCHDCGWIAPCRHCDARLTLHRTRGKLNCHHCGAEAAVPSACPTCGGSRLNALGAGTERIERALRDFLPAARIVRIDRDSTRARGALERTFERIRAGDADVLIGTQMLSKGHDFPNVTLVGVVDADQGLYSIDFRGPERLFQQILQVSGRAGRADKPGCVWIQTYHPDHAVFVALKRHDYHAFADYVLADRRATGYPPFSHLALLRAEASRPGAALDFLARALALAPARVDQTVALGEPAPAPMERRAGRYRAQLPVQSQERRALHEFLPGWLDRLSALPEAKKVRWSIDVDPQDMF